MMVTARCDWPGEHAASHFVTDTMKCVICCHPIRTSATETETHSYASFDCCNTDLTCCCTRTTAFALACCCCCCMQSVSDQLQSSGVLHIFVAISVKC